MTSARLRTAAWKAAYASAKSKLFTAFGDARQNNRPTFGFGVEYNRYAKFNNYNEYYLRFQHNNFDVGIQITLPLFDATRKARAKGSSAEAAQATAQADQLRDQAGEQILRLQKSVAELAAQEKVAQLQNELAQDQLDTITTQLHLGSGGAREQRRHCPRTNRGHASASAATLSTCSIPDSS